MRMRRGGLLSVAGPGRSVGRECAGAAVASGVTMDARCCREAVKAEVALCRAMRECVRLLWANSALAWAVDGIST